MSITELSIKRPLLITIVFTALILFGIISYTSLNYELLPKFDAGVLSISTAYPGASPQDVENNVTKPIEDAVSTIEGLDIITSKSMQNASSIILQLKSGVNDITAQQDVERKLNQMRSSLPTEVHDPVVNRFSSDQFPILNVSVSAKCSDVELYNLVNNSFLPVLTNVQGVGQINIIGGQPREIRVHLLNDRLNSFGISAAQVFQLISSGCTSYPAGDISSDEHKMLLRLDADVTNVETLRKMVIRENVNGSRVLLGDIASVTDETKQSLTINRINGRQGIGLQIFKTNDANSVQVSSGIKKKLEELKREYNSKGFNYEIASDQSIYTRNSADAVIEDLMMAVLIVGLVMLLFLHSIRSSMFVLVAIPSALIPTFIAMYAFGFTLNIMTLMALSLVVGILVDDSIVVLENIFRHLESGKDRIRAAIDGRGEIGFTAVAITMVDVVVFLPMAMAGGLIGNIVRQFALAVVFSTVMSLAVSFTLTPMLVSRFAKLEPLSASSLWGKINKGFEKFIVLLKKLYSQALLWSLHHKKYIVFLCLSLIVASVALIPTGFIGTSFLGNGDRGQLGIKLEMSADMPLYKMNMAAQRAEEILLKHPEVENVYSLIGTQTGVMNSVSNGNIAELDVSLIDKTKRKISTDNFGVLARDEIEMIPGVKVTVVPMSVTDATNSPIQVVVSGAEADSVSKAAEAIKAIMIETPGTDYVQFSTKSAVRQIKIRPDRRAIASLGLTVQDVAQSINLAFSGNDDLNLKDNGLNYSIAFGIDSKKSVEDLNKLTLVNRQGKVIRLSQVVSVEETISQSVLERTNRLSSITITSSAVGRPSGTIVSDIKKNLKNVKLPSSVTVDYKGDAKNQKEAFGSLMFALIIAVVLVYMIMAALYESLIYPFVVIFSVPVATIGALTAIALTMNQLTIVTIIGMIMLLGLVAKNGILIVDFANHLKSKGMSITEALIEAGNERLRPIMMTTFAMILGMLPLAFSNSPGSEFKNGMAWVLIGGLTSSFLFTLLLVPCVYMIVENVKLRICNRKERI